LNTYVVYTLAYNAYVFKKAQVDFLNVDKFPDYLSLLPSLYRHPFSDYEFTTKSYKL